MIRARQITGFRTDDEASNRFQEHLKEVLNPVLRELSAPQGWQAPTLQNGWVPLGGGFQAPGFMIDVLGFVHLRGALKGGTVNATMFTLPDGYRPAATMAFPADIAGGVGVVTVDHGGNVAQNAAVSNVSVFLDGVTFDVRP